MNQRTPDTAAWMHRGLPLLLVLLLVGPVPAEDVAADWRQQVVAIGNGRVRVVADALHGGRLVEYSLDGRNALFQDLAHPEWVYPDDNHWVGPAGGRFDIGPEETIAPHPKLWDGAWTVEQRSELRIRLVSAPDEASGLQLTREFALDAATTRLRCTQSMRNITGKPLRRSYWGRSLSPRGGVAVIALNQDSRFPHGFVTYTGWETNLIKMKPKDPSVLIKDGFALVDSMSLTGKIGFDSVIGWIAYVQPEGTMFLKRFPIHTDRRYADIAGLTISFWSDGKQAIEIEPMGPEAVLAPGQSSDFTEEWWLLPHSFHGGADRIDPAAVAALALSNSTAP